MSYKKPVLERVSKARPSDWIPVIQSLFKELVIGAIALMSAYSIYIGQQNKEVVREIKAQTDGQQTALKLAVAISARSLATATKNPQDEKTADEAEAAYRAELDEKRGFEQK